MPDDNEPLIEFINVDKKVDNKFLLKNINVKIYENDIFGVVGTSGAGKTSFLRTLIGIYTIDSGKVVYNNKKLNPKNIRKVFGFASQDNCIYNELTVYENLVYFGRMHNVSNKDIINNANMLLGVVELEEYRDVFVKDLSGGTKRRVDLACSLMHDPKVLIMDEPTAGLDPLLRKHMWLLIKKIGDSGKTIIISSHMLSDIEHMCNKVAIMYKGEILIADDPKKIKEVYSTNEEIIIESYPGKYDYIIEALKALDLPIEKYYNKDHKLILYSPRAETVLHHILHILEDTGEKLLEVNVNKPSMNEVFEAFINEKKDEIGKIINS